MFAKINLHYIEGKPETYAHISIQFENEEVKKFDSGDVQDDYNNTIKFLQENRLMSLFTSTFDHFNQDGGELKAIH